MVIIKLFGGLGNQMFQYAFGRYMAWKHQTELKFDVSFLLDRSIKDPGHTFRDFDLGIFGIDNAFATDKEIKDFKSRVPLVKADKLLNKLLGLKSTYILERQFHFSPGELELPDGVYLEGYWQSEKYFKPIEDQIRQTFVVKEKLLPESEILAAEIMSKNSVCVNIRRGDFVANPFHDILPVNYYDTAEEIIMQQVSDLHLYVFSDDLDWCYKNLKFRSPFTIVADKYAGYKYQDKFRLMSYCKHFIIPNSTYAWWAAYLAGNKSKIVIAPQKWFGDPTWNPQDLLLEDWIKIS